MGELLAKEKICCGGEKCRWLGVTQAIVVKDDNDCTVLKLERRIQVDLEREGSDVEQRPIVSATTCTAKAREEEDMVL